MKPKRFFFVTVALFVFAGASSVAGYILINKQLKAKSKEVSDLIATKDVESDAIDKLRSAKKSAQDLSAIKDLVDAAVPKQKNQDKIILDIAGMANNVPGMIVSKNGITASAIQSMTFNGSGSPDSLSGATVLKDITGVYSYPVTLNITDIKFETMINFLARIETNKRIMQVDQITIVPDPQIAGSLKTITINLKAYIQP